MTAAYPVGGGLTPTGGRTVPGFGFSPLAGRFGGKLPVVTFSVLIIGT
jgi:hypothetical protein